MSSGITQYYYLPPDRGDLPAITAAKAGTQFIDPGGIKRLSWVQQVDANTLLKDIPRWTVRRSGTRTREDWTSRLRAQRTNHCTTTDHRNDRRKGRSREISWKTIAVTTDASKAVADSGDRDREGTYSREWLTTKFRRTNCYNGRCWPEIANKGLPKGNWHIIFLT